LAGAVISFGRETSRSWRWRPEEVVLCTQGRSTAAILVCVAGLFFVCSADAIELPDETLHRWRDLRAAQAVLKQGPIATSWLAGGYVSNSTIEKLFALQEGSTLEIKKAPLLGHTIVVINKVQVKSGPDLPTIQLDLTFKFAGVEVDVQADALLAYRRTEGRGPPDDTGHRRTHAIFAAELTSISLSIGSLQLLPYFKRIQASGVTLLLSKYLEFPLPIEESIAPDIQKMLAKRGPLKIPVPGVCESIAINLRYAKRISIPLNLSTPLYVPDGVWLLAGATKYVPPDSSQDIRPTSAQIQRLSDRVRVLREKNLPPPIKADLAAFVNKKAIPVLLAQFKDDETRAVSFSSDSRPHLFKGTFAGVTLAVEGDAQFMQGVTTATLPAIEWGQPVGSAKSGSLSFSSDVAGRVDVRLKSNLSSIGSLGAHTVVHAKGSAKLNGTVSLAQATLDGVPTAMLIARPDCVNLPLSGHENGELHVKVSFGILAFDKPLPPLFVIDDVPRRLYLKRDEPKPSLTGAQASAPAKKSLTLNLQLNAIDWLAMPKEAVINGTGLWLAADLSARPPFDDAEVKARQEASDKRVAAYVKDQASVPACPKQDILRIEILGVKGSKNGEVEKAVSEILKATGKVILKPVEEQIIKPVDKVYKRLFKKKKKRPPVAAGAC
jgi:hypothetical protein